MDMKIINNEADYKAALTRIEGLVDANPDPPSSFPGTIIVGRPVIGLTLSHDRMDNFWFSIVHEWAHLYLHFNGGNIAARRCLAWAKLRFAYKRTGEKRPVLHIH